MGKTTGISWCDHTANPLIGCEKVSEACKNYAEESPPVRVARSRGLELWGAAGARHETKRWEADARKWNRAAARDGVRRRVFCASLADVFEDRPEWVDVRRRLSALVAKTQHLDWLFLTKRPENARRLWVAACPFANLTEDEEAMDRDDFDPSYCMCGEHSCAEGWAPFDIEWARSLREECSRAGVAYFCKQLGANPVEPVDVEGVEHQAPIVLRDSHGGDESEWIDAGLDDLAGCRAFPRGAS